MQVALAGELERHARVLRQGMVHLHMMPIVSDARYSDHKTGTDVIQEADTSRDGDLLLVSRPGLTVQVDGHSDICLVGLALNHCCACCHSSLRLGRKEVISCLCVR